MGKLSLLCGNREQLVTIYCSMMPFSKKKFLIVYTITGELFVYMYSCKETYRNEISTYMTWEYYLIIGHIRSMM